MGFPDLFVREGTGFKGNLVEIAFEVDRKCQTDAEPMRRSEPGDYMVVITPYSRLIWFFQSRLFTLLGMHPPTDRYLPQTRATLELCFQIEHESLLPDKT
jgi:hypothetical protein